MCHKPGTIWRRSRLEIVTWPNQIIEASIFRRSRGLDRTWRSRIGGRGIMWIMTPKFQIFRRTPTISKIRTKKTITSLRTPRPNTHAINCLITSSGLRGVRRGKPYWSRRRIWLRRVKIAWGGTNQKIRIFMRSTHSTNSKIPRLTTRLNMLDQSIRPRSVMRRL